MRRLDINTKKQFSAVFEFLILRGERIAKFRKIRIFKYNLALNYSTVKKFHMRGLDLITKKTYTVILEFLN